MERVIRTIIESAKRINTPRARGGFLAVSMLLATACDKMPIGNTVVQNDVNQGVINIDQPNGAVVVPLNDVITLHKRTNFRVCTGRATLPDFKNEKEVERYMIDSSMQGGSIHPGGVRKEGGVGTSIGWHPC